jgi:dienelactone hydrolase
MRKSLWIFAGLLAFAASACAQTDEQKQRMAAAATMAPDLQFPAEASPLASALPQMAIYKPDGQGPFPAVVLHHQCGGLRGAGRAGGGQWQNTSMLEWAKIAVQHGYVALVVDSLGPRGVESVCMGPRGNVNFARGVRDAFQAADHLRKLPYVDPQRVAHAGFSWGAMVGLMASREMWANALATGGRFRAIASMYPGCFQIRPPGGAPYDIIAGDVDTPLLVLMGDKDTETPASECLPTLESLKAKGAPVQWHVYPGTTHCWDCVSLDGFRKTDARGHAVQYTYDKAVTDDAGRRMFAFFDSVFARN